jgi:hypothetical protein
MASTVLANCGVYVNEFDLSGQANSVEATVEADELDASTFADNGYSSTVTGQKNGMFNSHVFLEYTSGMDASLLTSLGGTNVATVSYDPTAGSLAWLMKAANTSFSPLAGAVGNLAETDVSLKTSSGSFGLRSGKLLAAKAARGSTASTTGQQLFTSGTVTLLTAALHVTSGSGSTVVTVESAPTLGGSYTTRGTFTAATGATSEYISAVISTTDQYWRAKFTVGSGTTTAVVSAAVS